MNPSVDDNVKHLLGMIGAVLLIAVVLTAVVFAFGGCATIETVHPDGSVTRTTTVDLAGTRAALAEVPETVEALQAIREALEGPEKPETPKPTPEEQLAQLERAIELLERLQSRTGAQPVSTP